MQNIFSKIKHRKNQISITNSCFIDGANKYCFSNCLIAGTKSNGRDSLLRELIADSLNYGNAVFVIQNGTSLPNNTLRNEFRYGWDNRNFFEMDFYGRNFTQPINFFKGSSIDFVQELLLLLMSVYKELSSETRSFVERYLMEVMQLYKVAPKKKFMLSNILDFDEYWIISEAVRLHGLSLIDEKTKDRAIKYANNLVLYKKELSEYENFCAEIQKNDFDKLLSGNISYSQLNSSKFVTFITLDFISDIKQSMAFLQLFVHKAIYEMRFAKANTTFVYEDIDVSLIPEFRELLKACQSSPGNNCYFTCDSILKYANLDYDPRTYCNTYFVFRQSIMNEAEEWSKTGGTYKKDKATQTTSTYDQVYGERNQGLLGGLRNLLYGNKQIVTGTSHEIIDEYLIAPSEFMELPDKTSKVIIKTSLGKPYIMQVIWP